MVNTCFGKRSERARRRLTLTGARWEASARRRRPKVLTGARWKACLGRRRPKSRPEHARSVRRKKAPEGLDRSALGSQRASEKARSLDRSALESVPRKTARFDRSALEACVGRRRPKVLTGARWEASARRRRPKVLAGVQSALMVCTCFGKRGERARRRPTLTDTITHTRTHNEMR